MRGKIGTVFTGTVDQVGDESIQTKFPMLGVPLALGWLPPWPANKYFDSVAA